MNHEIFNQELLTVSGISKSFTSTKALNDVSVTFKGGTIHGLIGENGSGKSTLSSVITGFIKADSGTLTYTGKRFVPVSISDSRSKGICSITQEIGTIDSLSVAENIFLGCEDNFSGGRGFVSRSKLCEEARKMLDRVGATDIDAAEPIRAYPFEERKLVEVAAAVFQSPDLLIVDETTSALSQTGRETLYKFMETLRDEGGCVIFISHELGEVERFCDVVTVLKDGVVAGELKGDEVREDSIRTMMVGREIQDDYYRKGYESSASDEVTIDVSDVNLTGTLRDISFQLHRGEILGVGGLSECGMHELCKVVFGVIRPTSGRVTILPSGRVIRSSADAIAERMAYLPKDRDKESVFLNTSIMDNINAMSYDLIRKGPYISPRAEEEHASEQADNLSIKMRELRQYTREISGGNKQKVAFAKWLANDSQIFILDCPTRGIDVGVKQSIYHLMEEMVAKGMSIIMVSEELQELIGMSDRVLIMKNGSISAEFARSPELREQDLINVMI